MYSLYDVLLAQHARQLTPVNCAYSTIVQLHRYFEDVVLENSLNALVIESLPLSGKRPAREKARVRDLARGGRHAFFFVDRADELNELVTGVGPQSVVAPVLLPQSKINQFKEHFVVIADARFSALLATVPGRAEAGRLGGDEVFWTFEPDIVYSALEYLMARVSAQHPYQAADFESAVRTSMPKATSLQLTVSVSTKLAHLLQEQAGREIAVNRIATAIRESLELGVILQKTVDEVGTALNVASCALRVEGEASDQAFNYFYVADKSEDTNANRQQQPLSLIMLDLDRFKQLNDSAGHDDGDGALRKLGDCFKQELRGVDSAARFGGEEFALIPPHAYPEDEQIVAQRVRAQIES